MAEIIKYVERKIVFPIRSKVTSVKILDDGTSVEISYEVEKKVTGKNILDFFPIVRVSELTLNQGILAYTPETERQAIFKSHLEKALQSGLSDFRAQSCHPSYDSENNRLFYGGQFEAILTLAQWEILAKEVNPSKRSRLGTATERYAFLGYIIKLLVEKYGYPLNKAWYSVCDDSGKIAYFAHGSADYLRKIGPFSGLGNGYSITQNDSGDSVFVFFGGHPCDDGKYRPLANTILENYRNNTTYTEESASGWVVSDV